MDSVCLYVDVPICSFRPRWAREYQETYTLPPPATVFGMLLSLVGVDWPDKEQYAGVELALALSREPEKCRIFRKLRRVPQSKKNADSLTERRRIIKIFFLVCSSGSGCRTARPVIL